MGEPWPKPIMPGEGLPPTTTEVVRYVHVWMTRRVGRMYESAEALRRDWQIVLHPYHAERMELDADEREQPYWSTAFDGSLSPNARPITRLYGFVVALDPAVREGEVRMRLEESISPHVHDRYPVGPVTRKGSQMLACRGCDDVAYHLSPEPTTR